MKSLTEGEAAGPVWATADTRLGLQRLRGVFLPTATVGSRSLLKAVTHQLVLGSPRAPALRTGAWPAWPVSPGPRAARWAEPCGRAHGSSPPLRQAQKDQCWHLLIVNSVLTEFLCDCGSTLIPPPAAVRWEAQWMKAPSSPLTGTSRDTRDCSHVPAVPDRPVTDERFNSCVPGSVGKDSLREIRSFFSFSVQMALLKSSTLTLKVHISPEHLVRMEILIRSVWGEDLHV